ncbi:hypothetical protein, partial [Luteimonas sp. SDU101]|uniref:hypothetical protein n=1 Tax=Luteimonas sp. SDU101 TaxID=3422593 RepID=UPI003EBBAA7A
MLAALSTPIVFSAMALAIRVAAFAPAALCVLRAARPHGTVGCMRMGRAGGRGDGGQGHAGRDPAQRSQARRLRTAFGRG